MRRVLSIVVAIAALAAGCGDDEPIRDTSGTSDSSDTTAGADAAPPEELASTDLEDVEVAGDPGAEPTLTFEQPFGVEETTSRVVTQGDGATVTPSAVVTLHFVFVNGRDGSTIESSFDAEPADLAFEDTLLPGIFEGLDGAKVGSRVLVAIAPGEGLGGDPESGVLDTDTLLFFAEVLDVRMPLARADGEAVDPIAGLPTVTLAADGAPTITVPDADPPPELIAQPLIEGAGAAVESGQTITVHYTGVLWNTGEVFDSSWEAGTPATFGIGTGAVIAGWDEGLVDRTVGSQVLLVVPPAKGYPEGSPDGSITGTDTLVFVIDILATSG